MGPSGPQGVTGATGPTGATGVTGSQGATGPTGATGVTGSQGPSGPAGTNGTNGTNGAAGGSGPSGPSGATGNVALATQTAGGAGTYSATTYSNTQLGFGSPALTVNNVTANHKVLISIVGQIAPPNNTTTCYISFDSPDASGVAASDTRSINVEGSSGLSAGNIVAQFGATFLVTAPLTGANHFNVDVRSGVSAAACSFNNVSIVGVPF
jgi:hypothetical protein